MSRFPLELRVLRHHLGARSAGADAVRDLRNAALLIDEVRTRLARSGATKGARCPDVCTYLLSDALAAIQRSGRAMAVVGLNLKYLDQIRVHESKRRESTRITRSRGRR